MCQLCAIKDIATQIRWPKPLEALVKDLDFLVDTAHEEYEKDKAACSDKATIPDSLLEVLRLIATALDELEKDREKWWTAPEKREMRKPLDADCNQEKLTSLHKVNNSTCERIEAMQARLGTFVRWSLGMNGGIWELVHAERVRAG